jgi:hypothetical protein
MDTPELDREMPPPEFYHLVRSQIEHEDNLNSQRLSWFVASQAFLFTAYAIVIGNIQTGKPEWVSRQQNLLVMLIPAVSLLTGLLIYATILAGAVAMINLRKWYKSNEQSHESPFPPVQGYRLTQFFGQAAPLGLPPIFIAIWLVLLVSRYG